MAITTTVTWEQLRTVHDSDLSDLRDAYEELRDYAEDEHGDGALDRPLPSDAEQVPDDKLDLWVCQRQAEQYEQAAKQIEKHQHLVDRLAEEYAGEFEIKMLTGSETLAIEREIQQMARENDDLPPSIIQLERNQRTVDAAVTETPDGIETPSEAPHALVNALWEFVERYNNAGDVDFQAGGFGDFDAGPSPASAPSVGRSGVSGVANTTDDDAT